MPDDNQPTDENQPDDSNPGTAEAVAPSEEAAAEKPRKAATKRTAAKKTTAKKTAARKTTAAGAKKATTRKAAAKKAGPAPEAGEPGTPAPTVEAAEASTAPVEGPPATPLADVADAQTGVTADSDSEPTSETPVVTTRRRSTRKAAAVPATVLFQPPEPVVGTVTPEPEVSGSPDTPGDVGGSGRPQGAGDAGTSDEAGDGEAGDGQSGDGQSGDGESGDGEPGGTRRKRRRGGRRRRKSGGGGADGSDSGDQDADDSGSDGMEQQPRAEKQDAKTQQKTASPDSEDDGSPEDDSGEGSSTRRRRRRRRSGEDSSDDEPTKTAGGGSRARKSRTSDDQITAVAGSTRLEAKKQRRREGREAGRRRAPIVSEAEFLARRESVDRTMVIRERDDLTQIAVLEDKVLVEHYVARESQTSLIGNVYLGRVQNVLPSMEAAFIDIGKGRNAVLYAGEVNWSALGHKDSQARRIETVLSSGQSILVQVSKDPVGHKGARLTSQVSLAGRFLVYVPDGTTSGISRKLPDTERTRLKTLLKEIVPDTAGVIVRTAAEGAAEDELTRDVERLKARWEDIEKKAKGQGPKLLYAEPDLTLKVVRDLFTEDFASLVVQGSRSWDTVREYVVQVAPDLESRLERYDSASGVDVFSTYRIDEQIAKGLDRKVWLPSGGSLVIDRTEAMTVVDVNTGKFTGSGGNLEETVTKNNLEAAEEIVRQLRLRDIGGIIVVDFIDMVLESNRDLVLRRLVECLGRDRTRHQVAEVTSLGLVQMTRKRIGTGLLEAFSITCEHCQGRGVQLFDLPVEPAKGDDESRRGGRRGRGRGRDSEAGTATPAVLRSVPTPMDLARTHPPAEPRPEAEAPEELRPELPAASGNQSQAQPAPDVAPEHHGEPEVSTGAEAEAEGAEAGPDSTEDSTQHVDPVDNAADIEADPEPESTEATEPTEVAVATTAPQSTESTESSDAVGPAEPSGPPEPPRVVTRSRRRSASRPAGPPPAAAGAMGMPSLDGLAEPTGPDLRPAVPGDGHSPDGHAPQDGHHDNSDRGDHGDQSSESDHSGHGELSVPVKRRGSRRR